MQFILRSAKIGEKAVALRARAQRARQRKETRLQRARRTQARTRADFQSRAKRVPVSAEALSLGETEQRAREDVFRDSRGTLRVDRSQGRRAKTVASLRNLRMAQAEQDELSSPDAVN